MSISGMTGFAAARGALAGSTWAWETKSVNGRGLDIRVRVPAGYDSFEEIARQDVSKRFKRGSFQLNLSLESAQSGLRYRINEPLLNSLLARCGDLVTRGLAAPPSLDGLLTIIGVLEPEQVTDTLADDEGLRAGIAGSLTEALNGLEEARRQEGKALSGILSGILDTIAIGAAAARQSAEAQPTEIAAKLRQKLDELLSGSGIEPARLAQEAAIIAMKADVREELDRLDAHIIEARKLLIGPSGQGRRFDFLAQEFNREANTLCSKSASSELTRIGLDLKAAIDQLREQSQNVE
ncbi:MAG: YicC/YloC family endoribonuclease [Caulobacterales bacterium]